MVNDFAKLRCATVCQKHRTGRAYDFNVIVDRRSFRIPTLCHSISANPIVAQEALLKDNRLFRRLN